MHLLRKHGVIYLDLATDLLFFIRNIPRIIWLLLSSIWDWDPGEVFGPKNHNLSANLYQNSIEINYICTHQSNCFREAISKAYWRHWVKLTILNSSLASQAVINSNFLQVSLCSHCFKQIHHYNFSIVWQNFNPFFHI